MVVVGGVLMSVRGGVGAAYLTYRGDKGGYTMPYVRIGGMVVAWK